MNNATLILAQLKAEMTILKSELENCLTDFDYENAHFFQKTIRLKSLEIKAIEKRIQKNYEEIESCKLGIKLNQASLRRIEEKLESENVRQETKDSLLRQYEQYNQKQNSHLDELKRLQKANSFFQVDSDIVLEEVERLLDSNSKMLCLECNNHRVLNYVTIEYTESRLILEYVNGNILPRNRRVHTFFKRNLLEIGFQENDSHVWALSLDRDNVDAANIMGILSAIIFEIIAPTKKAKCSLFILDK